MTTIQKKSRVQCFLRAASKAIVTSFRIKNKFFLSYDSPCSFSVKYFGILHLCLVWCIDLICATDVHTAIPYDVFHCVHFG